MVIKNVLANLKTLDFTLYRMWCFIVTRILYNNYDISRWTKRSSFNQRSVVLFHFSFTVNTKVVVVKRLVNVTAGTCHGQQQYNTQNTHKRNNKQVRLFLYNVNWYTYTFIAHYYN